MTNQKNLVITASIFAMLCMPLLAAGNTAAKPRGVEAQAVEKAADDVEAAKKTIERLKSRFYIKTDVFTNRTTFKPKPKRGVIGWYKNIIPVIHGDNLFVRTEIFEEATYPDTITIKIGDKVTTYESIEAKTETQFSNMSYVFLPSGTLYETVFAFPDDSLLRYIASNAKEIIQDGISIRFSGKNGRHSDSYIHGKSSRLSKKLLKDMVEMIIETLELYDALQIVKRSEQQEIE